MFKKISITVILIILMSLLSLVNSVFYTLYSYHKLKAELMTGIDNTLIVSAHATNTLLDGENFHGKAKEENSISEEKDLENIMKLSKFAKDSNLSYVYSMITYKGRYYFTSSSATDEELESKNYDTYFTDYTDDASDLLKQAFRSGKITFDETPDKYGHFRSVFIPLSASDGTRYIVGADMEISYVKEKVSEALKISIIMGSFMFIFSILATIFIAHLITNPLKSMTESAIQLSTGQDLEKEIITGGFKEIGILADSLNRLRKSMIFARDKLKQKDES